MRQLAVRSGLSLRGKSKRSDLRDQFAADSNANVSTDINFNTDIDTDANLSAGVLLSACLHRRLWRLLDRQQPRHKRLHLRDEMLYGRQVSGTRGMFIGV
jgi:hypothetical protein